MQIWALKSTVKRRFSLHFLLENLSVMAVLGADGWEYAIFLTRLRMRRQWRFSTSLFDCAPGEGNFLQRARLCRGVPVEVPVFPPLAQGQGRGKDGAPGVYSRIETAEEG
jgi:hypothetical protein